VDEETPELLITLLLVVELYGRRTVVPLTVVDF
jgi:hypothetical protein